MFYDINTDETILGFFNFLLQNTKLVFFMFLNMVRKFQTVFCNFFSGHSTV